MLLKKSIYIINYLGINIYILIEILNYSYFIQEKIYISFFNTDF